MELKRWGRAALAAALGTAAVGAAIPASAGAVVGPPGSGTGQISGTIDDAAGNPITSGDVCAQAFQLEGSSGYYSYAGSQATANASGAYTITDLAAGTYKIGFADCGQFDSYAPTTSTRDDLAQYYGNTGDFSAASAVVLSDGGQKSGIDGKLLAGTSISGTTYGSADSSNPLGAVCVNAFVPSNGYPSGPPGPLSSHYAQSAISGPNVGSYKISYLDPAKSYEVSFHDCNSNATYLDQYYSGSATETGATTVSPTTASPATGIDAHLPKGGAISGAVSDASGPVTSDVCITATRKPGASDPYPLNDYGSSGVSPSDGSYRIGPLAPGDYIVKFADCGYGGASRNDAPQYWQNSPTSAGAQAVPVSAGAVATGISAVMQPGAQITGTIHGSGGAALASACVDAYPVIGPSNQTDNGSAVFTRTGANGSYTENGLTPGTPYLIQAYDCSNGGSYEAGYYSTGGTVSDQSQASQVTPSASAPTTGIDITLSPASTVSATRITGGPAPQASTNSSVASFSFENDTPDVTFECSVDSGSPAPCSSPFNTGTLSNGPHRFSVRAFSGTQGEANPPSVVWTVNTSSPNSTSSGTVPPGGGTVQSDPGTTASPSHPVVADVTLPAGGNVTLTKEPATTPSGNGYKVFGTQVDIAATNPDGTPLVGTPSSPITLSFTVDASQIPAGADPTKLTVERNGSPASNCTTTGVASPDPCVEPRTVVKDGSGNLLRVTFTVLTTHCSLWNFAMQDTGAGTPTGGTTTTPTATTPATTTPAATTPAATTPAATTPSSGGGTSAGETAAQLLSAVSAGVHSGFGALTHTLGTGLGKMTSPVIIKQQAVAGELITVVVSAPGARKRSKPVTVSAGSARAQAAGPLSVALRLTGAGRSLLAGAARAHHRLRLTVVETAVAGSLAPVKQQGTVSVAPSAKKHH